MDELDETPSEELFEELHTLTKSLVEHYNKATVITRKILAKVKHSQEFSDEFVLVPKAPMGRWLKEVDLYKESFDVNEFLEIFFSRAAKDGRLDYGEMTVQFTPAEMKVFQFTETKVSYFRFMSHLPLVFA